MRHGDKVNNLGRKKGHRDAMLSNMASSLLVNKRIVTTVTKAKELRKYVEPIITKSKENTTNNRRVTFSYLQNKSANKELFEVVGPAVAERPGGYVRIIKAGFRKGDNAEMAYIELVDFNEVYTKSDDGAKKKTRRSRRRGKKATESSTEEVAVKAKETPEESVVAEATAETSDESVKNEDAEEQTPEPTEPETDTEETKE